MRAKTSVVTTQSSGRQLTNRRAYGSVGQPTRPEVLRDQSAPTILLAEDDDDLRAVMTYFLQSLDFNVVACADAAIACDSFRKVRDIDLLMTDVDMPGRSGLELASELTALDGSLPVLIVSATILSEDAVRGIWQNGWAFLSKPCKLDVLIKTIHGLLRPTYPWAA